MSKIKEGVYFISGRDEMIPDSHTYVIGENSSNDLCLIDPGLIGKTEYKIDSIQKMGIDIKGIKRVILTHTHFDHIGGILEIKNRMPWVKIWIHQAEADLLEEGDERGVYGSEIFQQICQMEYNIKAKAFKLKVDQKLNGEEILNIGNMEWKVIHIPGHSIGSIALYNSHDKILISGDVIYADYAIGRFDLFGADGERLKKSLQILSKLNVDILLPGHNRIVKDLSPKYILDTLRLWENYI